MHFPSVSLFSSTANVDLSELFKKLGCESSTNAYSITGSTPLIDALFSEVNPIPVKAALAKMGYGTDTLRLPLTPMEEGRRAVLLNALKAWGV